MTCGHSAVVRNHSASHDRGEKAPVSNALRKPPMVCMVGGDYVSYCRKTVRTYICRRVSGRRDSGRRMPVCGARPRPRNRAAVSRAPERLVHLARRDSVRIVCRIRCGILSGSEPRDSHRIASTRKAREIRDGCRGGCALPPHGSPTGSFRISAAHFRDCFRRGVGRTGVGTLLVMGPEGNMVTDYVDGLCAISPRNDNVKMERRPRFGPEYTRVRVHGHDLLGRKLDRKAPRNPKPARILDIKWKIPLDPPLKKGERETVP